MASIRLRGKASLVSSASRSTDTLSSGLRDHGLDRFGPRVRFPDDSTDRAYVTVLTMTFSRLRVLAALSTRRLEILVQRLTRTPPRRGRPWSCSLRRRILIACAALRTNLTIRELAAVARLSKSAVHRIIATLTPRLAALDAAPPTDRRESWVVDGTLIPTRDHGGAARSKNYRWSCNAQVLVRRRDLRVIATAAGGAGNRNDPIHYRGSSIEALCKRHGRVLADGGYRGVPELVTPVFRRNRIVRDRAWRRHRR
ncbi:MAG TPA: helix-turn-helix domain-containing protein, partial [Caldimonas sp.]|nr:helix-turn-helix domain-containing protein [Caldimonas sp.]